MKRFYNAFLFLFAAMLFTQCQRDLSYIGKSDPEIVLPDPITAALQGNVLDEAGQPAPGVTITVGAKTATTDAQGYFHIDDASLDKGTSLVTAEKSGYFKAIRSFGATSGTNQVVIKLIKRTLAGTVNATAGGEASLSNGAKVALPANGVVVASTGAAYTGAVSVYAAYIDPTAADISETIPGSLTANDKNGGRVVLQSFGMMTVELQGASGEKLQIKSGATATLTTPIPASIAGAAPASISLWYVDETTGVWKEEGTATKNGANYVGEVKHFTFWNCDVSTEAIRLTVTLKNSEGHPLVHAQVRLKRSNGSAAYGWTDSLGQATGHVPRNEALTLEVLNRCGIAVYTQSIPAMTQNTVLPAITIGSSATAVITVKGKITTCSGTPVLHGFALITYDNRVFRAPVHGTAGEFAIGIVTCSNSAASLSVVGVDETAQQQSAAATVTVTTPVTNAGTINACGTSAAQFINYTLDGTAYAINSGVAGDSLTAYSVDSASSTVGAPTGPKRTLLNGMKVGTTNRINIRFNHNGFTSGTYAGSEILVNAFTQNTLLQPFNVVVTNMPAAVGGYYEGTFNGNFTSGGATHTLSGSFRLRRLQ